MVKIGRPVLFWEMKTRFKQEQAEQGVCFVDLLPKISDGVVFFFESAKHVFWLGPDEEHVDITTAGFAAKLFAKKKKG